MICTFFTHDVVHVCMFAARSGFRMNNAPIDEKTEPVGRTENRTDIFLLVQEETRFTMIKEAEIE